MKSLLGLTLVVLSTVSATADVLQDFDSLGGNDVLLERAEKLNPEKNIEVVQDRIVDRRWRSELNLDFAGVVGGDAYIASQGYGLGYQLHITPRWSVGLRGAYYFSQLRDEGKFLIDKAQEIEANASGQTKKDINSLGLIPLIDYPKYSGHFVAAWYPFYGKLNLHNLGIAQYDVYMLGGAGQMVLKSGPTPSFIGGGGLGFWLSQHLSSRFEARYETYEAKRLDGKERMNLTVLGFSMGYLL